MSATGEARVQDSRLSKGPLGAPIRVSFLSVMPSPYMQDLFQAIAIDTRFSLRVHYLEMAAPDTHWDDSENPPNNIVLLIKATGVPIDHYSYDTVESLRDMIAEWQKMRRIRESAAFRANTDLEIATLLRTPNIDLYAIDGCGTGTFGGVSEFRTSDDLGNLFLGYADVDEVSGDGTGPRASPS